jgi:hypothetical protein
MNFTKTFKKELNNICNDNQEYKTALNEYKLANLVENTKDNKIMEVCAIYASILIQKGFIKIKNIDNMFNDLNTFIDDHKFDVNKKTYKQVKHIQKEIIKLYTNFDLDIHDLYLSFLNNKTDSSEIDFNKTELPLITYITEFMYNLYLKLAIAASEYYDKYKL